jgi:hypothetical protein
MVAWVDRTGFSGYYQTRSKSRYLLDWALCHFQLSQVTAGIHFLAAVVQTSLYFCWLLTRVCSQLLGGTHIPCYVAPLISKPATACQNLLMPKSFWFPLSAFFYYQSKKIPGFKRGHVITMGDSPEKSPYFNISWFVTLVILVKFLWHLAYYRRAISSYS